MKHLLLITSLFFITNAQAQRIDSLSLDSFGRAYYTHYKKDDYQWITNNLNTYYKIAKDYESKNRKRTRKDKDTTWRNADFKYGAMRQDQANKYGIKGFVPRSDYVRTEIYNYPTKYSWLRSQQKVGIKIIFKRQKIKGRNINEKQEYYIDPGYWLRSPKGQWTFMPHSMGVYFNNTTNQTYNALSFLNYRGEYTNANWNRRDEIRSTNEVIYPREIEDKRIAKLEAERKLYEAKVTAAYEKELAEYKAKIKKGEKAEPPLHRVLENRVFMSVVQMADFPGGEDRLFEWIADNLEYPNLPKRQRKVGTVLVTFVVERDGSISNTTIVKSLGASYDYNAMQVLKKMPKWRPAKYSGWPMRAEYMITVRFK